MSNPLYNTFGRQTQRNGANDILAEINNFRATFKGDPREKVQELLNSGQMTQAQFNQLAQMANQIIAQLK